MSGPLSVKFLLEIGHNCSSPPYLLHSAITLRPEDRVPTREDIYFLNCCKKFTSQESRDCILFAHLMDAYILKLCLILNNLSTTCNLSSIHIAGHNELT